MYQEILYINIRFFYKTHFYRKKFIELFFKHKKKSFKFFKIYLKKSKKIKTKYIMINHMNELQYIDKFH
ncbi:hypothetical protein DM814_02395 [Blattabacterium punctulatus]|nr:hypothetical protein DM814_02395 [Blattabacterium punctulatus]